MLHVSGKISAFWYLIRQLSRTCQVFPHQPLYFIVVECGQSGASPLSHLAFSCHVESLSLPDILRAKTQNVKTGCDRWQEKVKRDRQNERKCDKY